MSIPAWLFDQLQHNQFLTAALVAAPATAITYALRQLPMRCYQNIKRQFSITVTFNSDVPDYLAVQEFVATHIASERFTRSFVYDAERKWDETSQTGKTVYRGLTPGYGAHFGWWNRRPVFIDRSQRDSNSPNFKEQLTLTFMTRQRARVEAFVAKVRAHTERGEDCEAVPLFINSGGWWRCATKLPKRDLATVFMPAGEAQRAIAHVRDFEARRDWYRQRGLPWHTGILLTGKPGTGKTSLVHALASELDRTLYYLNLGSIESDQQLNDLVATSRDWQRALLVIEDADAGGLNTQRGPKPPPAVPAGAVQPAEPLPPREPVTLSALLNVLDGLLTPDGLVVIASSNHPEKLDAALLRPGRFDLHLEVGDMDWCAFAAMARLFGHELPDDDPRSVRFRPAPGATLRAKLLEGGVAAVLCAPVEIAA